MLDKCDNKTRQCASQSLRSFALASLVLLSFSSLQAQESDANDALINLESFEELQQAFHSDSGNVRLVTLLSPT